MRHVTLHNVSAKLARSHRSVQRLRLRVKTQCSRTQQQTFQKFFYKMALHDTVWSQADENAYYSPKSRYWCIMTAPDELWRRRLLFKIRLQLHNLCWQDLRVILLWGRIQRWFIGPCDGWSRTFNMWGKMNVDRIMTFHFPIFLVHGGIIDLKNLSIYC